MYCEIITLLCIAFALRILVVKHAYPTFDTYGHIYNAKLVKEQKAGPFGAIIRNVVGAGEFRRLFLWHWILGFFPIKKVLRYQKWINPSIDALFSVLLYYVVLRVGWARQIALFIFLLYLLTPMWFSRLSSGPRINGLTPRLSSEIVTNLFFIVTLLPLGLPVWSVLVLGCLLSAFVLSSSKFGLQALIFLSPTISCITGNLLPLFSLFLGFLLAFTVSKGAFIKHVKAQVEHLTWYFKKNLRGEVAVSNRNSLSKLLKKPTNGNSFIRHAGVVLFRCICGNSYTSVLIKMPVLPIAFVLYLILLVNGTNNVTLSFNGPIVGPVIAGTALFLLINLPTLLFLGEAERYLNHIAFFIITMTVLVTEKLHIMWLLWLLLGFGIIYWIFESFLLRRFEATKLAKIKLDDKIISYLKSIKNPITILAYPYQAAGIFRIMLETNHKTIGISSVTREFRILLEKKYLADYPYINLNKLDEMSSELRISYLILEKQKLATRNLKNWLPSSLWRKLEIGESIYDVYTREFQ